LSCARRRSSNISNSDSELAPKAKLQCAVADAGGVGEQGKVERVGPHAPRDHRGRRSRCGSLSASPEKSSDRLNRL
jgi:hypothetical protein